MRARNQLLIKTKYPNCGHSIRSQSMSKYFSGEKSCILTGSVHLSHVQCSRSCGSSKYSLPHPASARQPPALRCYHTSQLTLPAASPIGSGRRSYARVAKNITENKALNKKKSPHWRLRRNYYLPKHDTYTTPKAIMTAANSIILVIHFAVARTSVPLLP